LPVLEVVRGGELAHGSTELHFHAPSFSLLRLSLCGPLQEREHRSMRMNGPTIEREVVNFKKLT